MSEGIREFLARRPELEPVLAALHDFYAQHGRVGGSIEATDTLIGPLQAILGRALRPGQQVKADRLDRALQASALQCTLEDLLVVRYGRLPTSKPELRQAKDSIEAAWLSALGARVAALPDVCRPDATAWVADDCRHLLQTWRNEGEAGEAAIRVVFDALARLPGEGADVPLAVFASQVAGDPHAFDETRTAGRLLTRLIEHRTADEVYVGISQTEEQIARFYRVGLVAGSIGSTVLTYGLFGDARWLAPMRETGDEAWLPFTTITRYRGYRAFRDVAFAVENQHVFLALRNEANALPVACRPTLLCTSGVLHSAAHHLIRSLVAAGTRLYYSGDFEYRGLEIADRLLRRYGDAVTLWRMMPADYRSALRPGAEPPKAAIANLRDAFPDLVPEVEAGGTAFQEALLDELWGDLRTFIETGTVPG